MTSKTKRKKDCPSCGSVLAVGAKSCPHCGKKLTSSRKKPGKGKRKSSKTDRIACPACLAWIPRGSERCPICMADIPTVYKVKVKTEDDEGSEPETDFVVEKVPEEGEEGRKNLCRICQGVLEGAESKCPTCGAALEPESRTEEPAAPVDSAPVEEPTENAEDHSEEPAPIAIVDLGLVAESHEIVSTDDVASSKPCNVCGAIIPKSFERCPVCNAGILEPPSQAEESKPTAEIPEFQPSEDAAIHAISTETPAALPKRTRRLKSKGGKTAPVAMPTKAPGRTNTIDFVNGLSRTSSKGRVNGLGVTNGTGIVNGTGISNGLGLRPTRSSAERTKILTRWQFLAVLVAIVIVVPVFAYISWYGKTEGFSIDGDFADWRGATTHGTMIHSINPSSNITEWAVATQGDDLFLYFKTQENMMSSSDAESYYMFVDSDGSDETGYVTESIGADYLLLLTGWDSTVSSSSFSQYSSSDQLDWNAWSSMGSLSYSKVGSRIEVRANMPEALGDSARFMLLSKDSMERGSVSYAAPLRGAVLIVEQSPSDEVISDGLVPKLASVEVLKIRFTSEGGSGRVEQINPQMVNASMAAQVPSFSLDKGKSEEVTIAIDMSTASDGQFVSSEVFASSIVSSYASVEVSGSGAYAYVGAAPATIAVDGAFADWAGRLSADLETAPATAPSVDIDEVGNVSNSIESFFYVSVQGDMCSGTFVPAMVNKPSGSGGGGPVVPTRHTAEDILSIYVDSDRLTSTGATISYNSKEIGADQKIEVRGLFGVITSIKKFDYSSGKWAESTAPVKAAKDDRRIEIGIGAQDLGGNADIDFIVETTSWKGLLADQAAFDSTSMKASTRTWIVDPLTKQYATSMSYQRKMFYDGVNFWSFFFDGQNTVHKYSPDNGQTWIDSGRVFNTAGVNETSIWYDSSTNMVYAVGDTSSPSNNVSIQAGIVDAAKHAISWLKSDSSLNTSRFPFPGKNTYISKDLNGYLWVLSTNWTSIKQLYHDLSAFRGTAVNSTSSWMNTGEILPFGQYLNNSKGSIVPAGSGSEMWAVYTYEGNVAAKKYNGAWPEDWDETVIYSPGGGTNTANTDNSPPSVVVDGNGVVHVVYGTARADKSKRSIPQVEYSHSNPDLTFTPGWNLDPSNDTLLVGNYYPTISLETSTNNLYVLWLQSDTTLAPKTVVGKKCVSGSWYSMTIEPQTSFSKRFMTSIYSVAGECNICWQWTQNATGPNQVLYDSFYVPEFGDITPLVVASIVIFAAYRTSSRRKRGPVD